MALFVLERYCDAVCAHIRSKAGRRETYRELRDHLDDHVQALTDRGVPLDTARERAVAAMGDPAEVGKALDKLYPYCPPALPTACTVLTVAVLLAAWGLQSRDERLPERFFWPDYRSDSQEEVLLSTGTARGGGKLGPYTFTPAGTAELVELPDAVREDGTPLAQLRVPLTITWSQPWLDEPDLYGNEPFAVEGEPDAYGYWSVDALTPRSATGELIFRVEEDFQSDTLRIHDQTGNTLRFSVVLPREVTQS